MLSDEDMRKIEEIARRMSPLEVMQVVIDAAHAFVYAQLKYDGDREDALQTLAAITHLVVASQNRMFPSPEALERNLN
jgi:hypothetical protein